MDQTAPRYAVIDVETTGGSMNRDRLTEIAVFITDGTEILDEFTTLLNPEQSIPPTITHITGITDNMVRSAPKFYEVARHIVEMTEGCVFVAHNVSFDYNFVKTEFKNLGYTYQRRRLCTVRLSRRLFPGLPSYSLGKLCKSLNIELTARHRAFGDARATVELLHKCLKADENGLTEEFQKYGSPEANLPPNLSRETFENLPDGCGVYYFHDKAGKVIYVGKAVDIRSRISGHFGSANGSRKALVMKDRIFDISYEEMGSELVALLQESHEIKRLRPVFNIAQKRDRGRYGLFDFEDRQGYRWLRIGKLSRDSEPHTTFTNGKRARAYLVSVHRKYNLCEKHDSKLEESSGCFRYQIGMCEGACMGHISPEEHNAKVEAVVSKLNVRQKSIAIIGDGRAVGEGSVVWIEHGVYHGYGFFDTTEGYRSVWDLKDVIRPKDDNQDVQRILNQHLRQNPVEAIIELFPEEAPADSVG